MKLSRLHNLWRAAWLLPLWLLVWAPSSLAHQQGSSYSQWRLGAEPSVQLRISELDLTRVALHAQYTDNYHQQVLGYVQSQLWLNQADQRCQPLGGKVSRAQPGWLAVQWQFQCPENKAATAEWMIESQLLLTEAPGHLHFARLNEQPAGRPRDQLLTSRSSRWHVDLAETEVSTGFGNYLWLGAIHIWEGWDHLAFVLALLLLATSWRQLAWLISGFTVGHSATLVLATIGWLAPNIVLIEAVIAWSIALLAAELLRQQIQPNGVAWHWWCLPLALLLIAAVNDAVGGGQALLLWLGLALFTAAYALGLAAANRSQQAQLRTAITIAFGLIHGCGFAAVLGELALPKEQLFLSLLGFNLGVELGQLALVLPLWPLLRLAQDRLVWLAVVLAYGLLALASYWWWLRIA